MREFPELCGTTTGVLGWAFTLGCLPQMVPSDAFAQMVRCLKRDNPKHLGAPKATMAMMHVTPPAAATTPELLDQLALRDLSQPSRGSPSQVWPAQGPNDRASEADATEIPEEAGTGEPADADAQMPAALAIKTLKKKTTKPAQQTAKDDAKNTKTQGVEKKSKNGLRKCCELPAQYKQPVTVPWFTDDEKRKRYLYVTLW